MSDRFETRRAVERLQQPAPRKRFMSMGEWVGYSGMSRSGTYLAIARGHIRAVKMARSTRIDVASGDEYLDRLPAANIKPSAA